MDADPTTESAVVRLRLDPALHPLLAPRRRGHDVEVPWDGTSSIGHLVESVGVPLTEVGELVVDGVAVPPGHQPSPGDVVTVAPVRHPQPAPGGGPPRFLLDVHLGTLARRLRLLGVDTAYRNDAADPDLVALAVAEARVLLTRDRGLLRRRALPAGALVRSDRPDDQVREVLTRFAPPLAPYTRCPACNGPLERTDKAEVADRLQPGTRRSYDEFSRCRDCGQVYWPGAHAGRLAELIRVATGVSTP